MRKTNKMIAFLLTLCMMFSLAMPLAANAATITFSDVTYEHVYYDAITNLAAEGILNGFEDGSFKPEEAVTRAQFTKIICYALDSGDLRYGEDQRVSFPDVDPNHWAIDNITTAYNSKIINGYDDGTFKPENTVLYEQAVKMAVCALGYPNERAERSGGYPDGYIKIASDIKMLKRLVGVKVGEPLTRGSVAQLIDNMRDAELYSDISGPARPDGSQTGGSLRDNPTSTTAKQQINGRIVAVYGSSIYYNEVSQCNKKQIELDVGGERIFFGIENLGINDTSAYLGRTVTVYYEHDNSADYDEATNIIFQSRRNKEMRIPLEDIYELTGSKLKYYTKNGEPQDISIDLSDLCIILNGSSVNQSLQQVLTNAANLSGYVTLVCSQNEDIVDLVFVRTYETIIAGSKDTNKSKVYNYYKTAGQRESFTLDETDRSKTITFTKDGKPATFANIAQYNVLSVSESPNGSLIDVQISTTTKKGKVTEVMTGDRIRLDGDTTTYRLTANCKVICPETITAGSYVTLYLDAFGTVARYTFSAEKTYTFGYLAAAESGTMMEPKFEVMVYKTSTSSAKATATIYKLKDNVRIDGETHSVSRNSEKIMRALEAAAVNKNGNAAINGVAPTNAGVSQPIRFTTTTSSSDEIDQILTSKSTGDFNVSMNITDHMSTPLKCLVDGTTLDQYTITGVPILVIPSNRMSDDYVTRNSLYFKKGDDKNYYVQLANVSTSKKPAAIYVYVSAEVTRESITEDHIPMIVMERSTTTYQNETRIRLKLMGTDGVTTEVYDDGRQGTELMATLQIGDVIRVATDDLKLVDAIELLASATAVANGTQPGFVKWAGTSSTTVDDREAPFRVVLGMVESAASNNIVIKPSFNTNENVTTENYAYTDGVKLFLIDTKTTNQNLIVTETVFGEIAGRIQQPGNASKLMVYTADAQVKAMIIFR